MEYCSLYRLKTNESFKHLKLIVVSASTVRHKDENVKLLIFER